jgi:hypothetical protein
VYTRYVALFPKPLEQALEVYNKMALAYQGLGETGKYLGSLKKIVALDRKAGKERSDRTHYLAAQAALVLTKPLYEKFVAIKLVKPLKRNLLKKKKAMKAVIKGYSKLVDYEVADVTAAATYYMAETYYHFSRALMKSERPDNLSSLELEQYELALEDQIYPFEEKAIDVHKKNVELLYMGLYSNWIDKSIGKLAQLVPARYARDESSTGFIVSIDSFRYVSSPATAVAKPETAPQDALAASEQPAETAEPAAPAAQGERLAAAGVAH